MHMIKLIRLVTGDDVICEIERKGEVVVLKKPHRLIFSREGLASMPLCPFAKSEDYEISAQNVLFEAEPEDEIKNSYLNQIGAIILPNSGLLTP
jgi:hypothetical protein